MQSYDVCMKIVSGPWVSWACNIIFVTLKSGQREFTEDFFVPNTEGGFLHPGWELDRVVLDAGRQFMGMKEVEDAGALVMSTSQKAALQI